MTINHKARKVRTNFDKTKEYSVNVVNCTAEEKEAVQQAFFDVGILWADDGSSFQNFNVARYTNALSDEVVYSQLMYGKTTKGCNMTPNQFLELVYEPTQSGHVHAELMAQYAEDAKTTDKPWELWQLKGIESGWDDCTTSLLWLPSFKYRRKTKTRFIHGIEIPDLRASPAVGEQYYHADPSASGLYELHKYLGDSLEKLRIERGLTYEYTKEGKQAAILHAKIMLGIA